MQKPVGGHTHAYNEKYALNAHEFASLQKFTPPI